MSCKYNAVVEMPAVVNETRTHTSAVPVAAAVGLAAATALIALGQSGTNGMYLRVEEWQ